LPGVGGVRLGLVDATSSLYKGYRFPVEIISHWCVQQRGLVDHVSG
jgi:hypothetical protein